MPDPNAIVSTTVRLVGEDDKQPLGELVVELQGERRVRLDPENPRSAGFARVLHGLSSQRLPVYVEVDPGNDTVARVLIPVVGRVVALAPVAGGLGVELDTSHAVRLVRSGDEDAAGYEAVLRRALEHRRPMLLVPDEAGAVIHVRELTPDVEGGLPPFPPHPWPKPRPWPWRLLRRWWLWLRWWLWWPIWWLRCPSATRAQEVFDAMAATTCEPLAVPPPCIPFLYPDDGCWARAHEMCRLMIDMDLSPRKVWIDHSPATG